MTSAKPTKNMFFKMHNTKSILGYGFHYSNAAGLLGAVATLTQPWILPLAGGMAIASKIRDEKKTKAYTEKYFQTHRKNHPFSPNLQKMVNSLYKRSGLDHHKAEIFDYDHITSSTPNAGFIRKMGKPMILISNALLEAFEDDEEYAVLAHEFAHAASMHHRSVMPYDIINDVAKTSASLAVIGEAVSTGALGLAITAASALAVGMGVRKHLSTDKKVVQTGFGVLSSLNPVFLGTFVASKALRLTSALLEKSFSRTREYQADRGAVLLGASPLALIKALRKMKNIQNDIIENKHYPNTTPEKSIFIKSLEKCFATHPATEKRIARLTDIAREHKYTETDIQHATTAPLSSLNVDKNVPSRTIIDITQNFIGKRNTLQNEYNNANDGLRQKAVQLASLIPHIPEIKMG